MQRCVRRSDDASTRYAVRPGMGQTGYVAGYRVLGRLSTIPQKAVVRQSLRAIPIGSPTADRAFPASLRRVRYALRARCRAAPRVRCRALRSALPAFVMEASACPARRSGPRRRRGSAERQEGGEVSQPVSVDDTGSRRRAPRGVVSARDALTYGVGRCRVSIEFEMKKFAH